MTDLSGYEARNAERGELRAAYTAGACHTATFLKANIIDPVTCDVRELIAMVKERDARIAELERGAIANQSPNS